jgi:hypothetical protein
MDDLLVMHGHERHEGRERKSECSTSAQEPATASISEMK